MKLLFWFSLIFIIYTYLGYPLILFIWSKLFPKRVNKKYIEPFVSVVIAAHNEEKNIKGRIENLLEQDYPKEKLEIIVVSDGSTDGTNEVVREFRPDGIKLLNYNGRKGKPYALNLGVREAKGEIIVFTDARQRFEKNAIKELVANFNDSKVGCVTGELVFYKNSESKIKEEMGAYWNYEKWIRKKESQIGSVVGATGAIYAIRKKLYERLPDDTLSDDSLISMNIILKGYRTIFDSKALAYDNISKDFKQEKRRKIRTLSAKWQQLTQYRSLINPLKNPIFFQFISHKIMRMFLPFHLIALFLSTIFLKGYLYKFILIGFFMGLILSTFPDKVQRIPLLYKVSKLSRTSLVLNYFIFLSFFYFLYFRKDLKSLWKH